MGYSASLGWVSWYFCEELGANWIGSYKVTRILVQEVRILVKCRWDGMQMKPQNLTKFNMNSVVFQLGEKYLLICWIGIFWDQAKHVKEDSYPLQFIKCWLLFLQYVKITNRWSLCAWIVYPTSSAYTSYAVCIIEQFQVKSLCGVNLKRVAKMNALSMGQESNLSE